MGQRGALNSYIDGERKKERENEREERGRGIEKCREKGRPRHNVDSPCIMTDKGLETQYSWGGKKKKGG